MHWLSGLSILLGLIALGLTSSPLGILVIIGLYLLWRTC